MAKLYSLVSLTYNLIFII